MKKRSMSRLFAGMLATVMTINGILTGFPSGAEDVQAASVATLTVDLTDTTGGIIHGAAGFLYGISNEDVPTTNTMTPLKPKVLATKGALGTEHPYGDALDVAKTFLESGGEQVMMYNSNYYGVFGVTADYREYSKVLKEIIAPAVVEWKEAWKEDHKDDNLKDIDIDKAIVYIPINEGTPVVGASNFNVAWESYYDAIKSVDVNAVIAGPNSAAYNTQFGSGVDMQSHIQYCANNDCMPDVITWHDLQVDKLEALQREMDDFRDIWNSRTDWRLYKLDNPECFEDGADVPVIPQICINEYADYADCGVPGRLVNWIARLEDQKVYGCLPFWHQANNLNDLTADANEGNGAWWVYKWYGDMSGQTVNVSTSTRYDGLYGVASIDDTKKIATTLFGGVDGAAAINLLNVNETEAFKDAEKVHVKVQSTAFSGYHGAKQETPAIIEGTFPVNSDGSVIVSVNDMKFSTAYNVTITEAGESEEVLNPIVGQYQKVYEAEEAEMGAGCTVRAEGYYNPRYYLSAGEAVEMTKNKELTYSIEVPMDGKYQLDFIFGNGTDSYRNDSDKHCPLNVMQTFTIDETPAQEVVMESTLLDNMTGIKTLYADLTAGKHTIKIVTTENGRVLHDSLTVTWNGVMGQEVKSFSSRYEAEQADFNLLLGNADTTVRTESGISDYSGNGYVTGLEDRKVTEGGGIRWNVIVKNSGMYNVTFRYQADAAGTMDVYQGNTSRTLNRRIKTLDITDTSGEWTTVTATIYFQKGINIVDVDANGEMILDYMQADALSDEVNEENSTVIEAEDCIQEGSAIQTAASRGASGGTYVVGMAGDENAASDINKSLKFTYNAPAAGTYQMRIFQSNNDICGTHWYNTKIIDKYVSVKVNDQDAERYFFINTFSDDTFKEKTITVQLNEGENNILLYNDDSWHVTWGGTTATPGLNKLYNYAPNFDKFVISPLTLDQPVQPVQPENEYGIQVVTTAGGYAAANKDYVAKDGEFDVLIVPEKSIEKVLLNEEDVTEDVQEQQDGTYKLHVTGVQNDMTVKVYFSEGNGEYIDEYITNAGFGTGNANGWETADIAVEKTAADGYEGYYAKASAGSELAQTVTGLQPGYYAFSVYSKGSSVEGTPIVIVTKGEDVFEQELSVTDAYVENTIVFEVTEENQEITIALDTSSMTSGDLYLDNFTLAQGADGLAPRDESLISKEYVYLVDCGDHYPDTVTTGSKFGQWNHMTDQIFGKDIRTGYKWGVVTSEDDSEGPAAAGSYGAFTRYQWINEHTVIDDQPLTSSFRYAHDQMENGYATRYVKYRFQIEPGVYNVSVTMGNAWDNSGNPDVYAGTGDASSDKKLNTKALNIGSGQNEEVSGEIEIAEDQKYLEVYALSSDPTINMNCIKIKREKGKLLSIHVTAPEKTVYAYGEDVDYTGMVIQASYEYMDEKVDAKLCKITGFDSTKAGEQEITVSYTSNGVTVSDTFKVTVNEKEATGDKPTPPPTDNNTTPPATDNKPTPPATDNKPTPPPTDDNTAAPVATAPTKETILADNPGLPKGTKEESANSKFGELKAFVKTNKKTSNKIQWSKVAGADGYVVFGNKCNGKSKKYAFEVLSIIENSTTTSYTHKKLAKATYYKYMVQAYKMVDGKVQIISTSKTIHTATKSAKYANVKSLKVNKTNITLKKKGTFKLKVTQKKTSGKTLKEHRKVKFESSNLKVATVNSKGVIKAKRKGTCYIYAYAQNGAYKKIKVKVK